MCGQRASSVRGLLHTMISCVHPQKCNPMHCCLDPYNPTLPSGQGHD